MAITPTSVTAPAATTPSTGSTDGRDRILDVAAESFLNRGYEATSLRQIADAVGMKAGSLYYHFASKDELLTEVLRLGIAVMQTAFDDAEADVAGADARERVAAHVRAHLAALYENGPYTAAHVTTFRTAPASVRAGIVILRDDYESRWTALLGDLQSAGELNADVNINLARLSLFGAMNSSVDWFDPARGSLDRFAATITRQFWNGVSA